MCLRSELVEEVLELSDDDSDLLLLTLLVLLLCLFFFLSLAGFSVEVSLEMLLFGFLSFSFFSLLSLDLSLILSFFCLKLLSPTSCVFFLLC